MKKLHLFLTLLISTYALQVCFAQDNNKILQPYIKVVDCKNCNEIAIYLPNPEISFPIGYGAHKHSGKVFVQILINEEGNVESAKSISGHPFFRPIVEKAALKAKFKPTIDSEKPTKITGIIIYEVNAANLEQLTKEKIIIGGIVNGKATYLPKPEYTEEAKNSCASGNVEVKVKIYAWKGNVVSAKAISGDELLRESAERAALQAKFAQSNIHGDQNFYVAGIVVYNFVPERKCIAVNRVINERAKYLAKPIYPKSCRCQGIIKVRIVVDMSGNVISARADSGNSLLRASAVEAAYRTKFAPTLINSSPILVVTFLEYKFFSNGKVST